jgi:hypothetical protein
MPRVNPRSNHFPSNVVRSVVENHEDPLELQRFGIEEGALESKLSVNARYALPAKNLASRL